MANAPSAERIWINRLSKLVRFISLYYGAARLGSITAFGLCIAIWAGAATAGSSALFCVLVPHFKDEYWLSVSYGLEQEAARQNVDLLFFEAGGYDARAEQIEQLEQCQQRGVDAILIGAVTSDHPDLTGAVERIAQDIPVFALVNELHIEAISGRIGVDWRDMGSAIGHELSLRHPRNSPPKQPC